ncbi:MAG: GNAT family N-acetyltransferase [Desulfobacterales bacterium]|nr:GNAT family N-acetyltransferase [Desulfobacterales bacterium]
MKIRKTTAIDIKTISKTIRSSYLTVAKKFNLTADNCPKHPSNCSDEWIKSDFERGVKYYILESEEGVIGCAALEKADSELCYLERLAVLPEKRNRGFGKILIDHIFMQAKSLGCKRISIGIIAKQEELKKWYHRLGFIEGETKEFEHLPFQVSFMEYNLT